MKVVQITSGSDDDLCALRDDGTIFTLTEMGWKQLPGIPGTVGVPLDTVTTLADRIKALEDAGNALADSDDVKWGNPPHVPPYRRSPP